MATIARLNVLIGADASNFTSALKGVESRLKATGRRLESIGSSLSRTVTLPILGIGAAAVKMAVDAEESANKFNVVMGQSAESVRRQLLELGKVFPATVGEMESMTAGVQDLLVPMGVARVEAAQMSVEVLKLAGDIASFNNVATPDVLNAFRSALAGESEPLRRFGIDVRETALKTVALEHGLIEAGQAMSDTARAQAVLLAATEDSADAIGDLERTQGSAANQTRLLLKDLRQLGEDLGKVLIPAFREVVSRVRGFTESMQVGENRAKALKIVTIGLAAAVTGPVLIAVAKLTKAIATLGRVSALAGKANIPLLVGSLALAVVTGKIAQEQFDKLIGSISGLNIELAAMSKADKEAKLDELNVELDKAQKVANDARQALADFNAEVLKGRAAPEVRGVFEGRVKAAEVELNRLEADIATVLISIQESTAAAGSAIVENLVTPTVQGATKMNEALRPALTSITDFASSFSLIGPSAAVLVETASHIKGFGEVNRQAAMDAANAWLETEKVVRSFEQFGIDTASRLGDAFAAFATGSKNAFSDFVESALRDLAALIAKTLIFKAIDAFAPGLGSIFGGLFADGGFLPSGQFGIVGESGPELIQAGPSGASISPMDGLTLRVDTSSLPPIPPVTTPETLAVHDYYRRLFGALVADGLDRGVSFA